MNNERTARKNLLRKGEEVKGVAVKGYDFNQGVNYTKILESFETTGYQSTHFSKAVQITREMIKEKATIFLGYTSNMVSSGLRDVFRYLVEHKKIHIVVTTAGGIEEDVIKCLGDFILGDFRENGKELRKKGINRMGNILVPNNRYVAFEEWMQELLEELYLEQKKSGKTLCGSDLIWKMGEKINNPESVLYWVWKHKIPVHCPALGDGALGDNIYFFSFKHDDFKIDIVEDIKRLNNTTIGLKKTGVIILGSGVVKHAILNANMLRNGADYAVYINTAQEFDGSDAGALPEEAVSWGKILPNAQSVKVFADATLVFPLLVAETFAQ
ncbi:MAG: deoxyhypusine synthase [Nanoarchaeota archaeon]